MILQHALVNSPGQRISHTKKHVASRSCGSTSLVATPNPRGLRENKEQGTRFSQPTPWTCPLQITIHAGGKVVVAVLR